MSTRNTAAVSVATAGLRRLQRIVRSVSEIRGPDRLIVDEPLQVFTQPSADW